MMAILLLGFVVVFSLVMIAVSVGAKYYEARRKRKVTGMLQTVAGPEEVTTTKLLRDLEPAQPSALGRFLKKWDPTRRAAEELQQAGMDWPASRLLGLMALAAAAGLVGALVLTPSALSSALTAPIAAAAGGALPFLFVRKKARKRLADMEEQLPEALDFLSRSMRAGHAFTISLEMLGEELPDPLGQEFRTLFNEQNLGAPIDVAMRNLSVRVPLLDVRFFCSAVLLQRQTGGNLSEILGRLAYLIRERFRLKGQVKAASAHGRMTAMVLMALPAITVLGLIMVAPEYLKGMAADSDGRLLIGGAVAGQLLGQYFIKKIINIKV